MPLIPIRISLSGTSIMKKLSDWLRRLSVDWVALSSLVIFVLFTALVLPRQAANGRPDNGEVGSPDLSFYYTANELYEMAEAYGEDGRRTYIRARFSFDLIWPFVYSSFLCIGISWVNRRAFEAAELWQFGNLVPLAGGLCDLLENTATSLVMLRYPRETDVIDVLAAVFTTVKWTLVGSSMLLLILSAAVGAYKWARRKFR